MEEANSNKERVDELAEVRLILADILQLGADRTEKLERDSRLLGSIPELDSMAVVSILTGIEDAYGITIYDDEIDAEVFETLGTLVDFVESKLA